MNQDADHRYMMFSATFPKQARQLATEYMMQDYVRIHVGRPGSAHRNVNQTIVWVNGDLKLQALYDLLMTQQPGLTLIFCNSTVQVEKIDDFLYNRNLPTAFMHGKRTQYEREDAMYVCL